MKLEPHPNDDAFAQLTLSARELRLLRLALQRASFVDTPPEDQVEILEFCTELLERMEPTDAPGGR